MDLVSQFDCRFVLVADRYEFQENGKSKDRSIEDIKERFYQIQAVTSKQGKQVRFKSSFDVTVINRVRRNFRPESARPGRFWAKVGQARRNFRTESARPGAKWPRFQTLVIKTL